MSVFWDRFYELSVKKDGSPNATAKLLKIPSGSITAWKEGSMPRVKTLVKIADHLSVPLSYLTGDTDDPTDRSKTHWIELVSDKKEKPTLQAESEPFVGYSDLTDDEKEKVKEYAAFLLASRHKK